MPRQAKNQTKFVRNRIKTSVNNFYANQTHVKAVDNLRRTLELHKDQLTRMFNQLNTY